MTSELWEVLVPTVRQDGRPYRTRYHRVWDERVRQIAGGLTILHPTKGTWTSPVGAVIQERMIPVRVACNEIQIQKIMSMTMNYYDQQAVMAYRVSDRCIILEREG